MASKASGRPSQLNDYDLPKLILLSGLDGKQDHGCSHGDDKTSAYLTRLI
jgi:hypothetical protein